MNTKLPPELFKGPNCPKLSPKEFKVFQELIYKIAGIRYTERRSTTLAVRVHRRVRALKLSSVEDYLKKLEQGKLPGEIEKLIEEVTTNETYFFRCLRHWRIFEERILRKKAQEKGKRDILKVWSAACSNGSEPYTIALLCAENLKSSIFGPPVKILATDINTQIMKVGINGVYQQKDISRMPKAYLAKYFTKRNEKFELKQEVKSLVVFKKHNLLDPPPEKGFHVVFLRNVLIYFDKESKEKVFRNIHDAMVPGGYLFLGESESTVGLKHPFKYIEPSFYRKME